MTIQENLQDNINKYTNNINELLVVHESMVKLDADQNLLSRAVLSEYFYCDLLNTLMGWKLKNANLEEKNTPGIDLIDVERHIVVQVSLTCNHEKIQSSINKFQKPDSTSDWEFYFVPLNDDIPYFKKDFVTPKGVIFDKDKNIFTKKRIVQLAKTPSSGEHCVDKLKKVSDILDKLMLKQKNHDDICEYLLNVLKNKRKFHPSFKLMDKDGIDKKLFTYPENKNLIPSMGTDGKKVAPIWDFIKEEHKEGFRHIVIEGDGGIGKSVSLLSVTDDRELLSRIPAIYIHMYELCKDGKCISLADYFKNNCSGFDEKISQLAAQPDSEGRPTLLLLLDGLNEVEFKLQCKLINNIVKWTEYHCGTQLIVASRPIPGQQLESILNNAVHIRLKPLEKESIKERLKTFGVTPPDDSSPIWETLKLPLFLTLYAKTTNLPDNTSLGYPIVRCEPVGPATIIWNYLQRELLRKEEESWVLNCAFACEYISPEIAYRMALLNRFELSRDESQQFVDDEAVYTTNRLPEHLSQIKECYIEKQTELPPKVNWKNFVFKETGIFVAPKRWTYKKETDKYSFMHQSFRDCLAGLHLVNVAQMAKNDGELPSEWESSIPPLVLDYAAELMDADTAGKLWELNRKRCVKGAKIDNTSTYVQLELHRRLKTESGKLDFSGMDLRGMSLTNYMGGEYDLGLFASPELASGTYFDRKVFQSDGHQGAIGCILSLDNGYFASGAGDKTIKIWDPNTGECIKTLKGNSDSVNCLAVLPDGKLVGGSADKTIKIWDTNSGKCIKTIKGHSDSVNCLAVLSDGKLVSCSFDDTIKIWDPDTGECIKTLKGNSDSVNCLAVLPDGKLVGGSYDKTIKIWDLKKRKCIKILKGHSGLVHCLAVFSDGHIIGGSDKTIKIWDTKEGKCIKTLEGHSDWVNSLAVLPDGKLVSGSYDKTIKIWDLKKRKCIKILKGHSGLVHCLAVLPDGRLVIGSGDNTIKILDPDTGECIKTLEGHFDSVLSLAVLPDGKLVSGFLDNTIKIWDPDTGECIKTLGGHSGPVECLAVLPDGRLVSGSGDNTIKIWDPDTGCIDILETTEVNVSKMDFAEAFMTKETAKLLYQNGAIVPESFIKED